MNFQRDTRLAGVRSLHLRGSEQLTALIFFFGVKKEKSGVKQPRKRNAKLGLRMAVRRKGGRGIDCCIKAAQKRVGTIKHQYITVCPFMQSCRLLSLACDPELPPADCQWADKVPAEAGVCAQLGCFGLFAVGIR